MKNYHTKYYVDEYGNILYQKDPIKTFIGGLVIGLFLGLFAAAVYISIVILPLFNA